MSQLTHEIRTQIVQKLACFEKPADVQRWLKTDWEIEVDLHKVLYHDPNRPAGRNLSARWRTIFDVTRKAYLTDVASVPIANQGYRLAQLQEMYVEAKAAKNRGQALQIMEQAAKEMGGVYSNVRTLNTPDMVAANEIPQSERGRQLASIIDGAFGRDMKNVTPALPGK